MLALPDIFQNELIWFPQRNFGCIPRNLPTRKIYDDDYYLEYEQRGKSQIGKKLNDARVEFVDSIIGGQEVLDFGCGNCDFIEARNDKWNKEITLGFDVMPQTIARLTARDLYQDPYLEPTPAMTFFDTLEHLIDPSEVIRDPIVEHVFISIPIFENAEHALKSRHLKPSEHYLYFSSSGLKEYMKQFDFKCVKEDDFETRLGREDIGSFAFER